MAISKKRKEELVAEYQELLEQSRAVFLTEYSGLNVKQMQKLRAEARKANATYRVTKNTLLQLALDRAGMSVPDEFLVGQLAAGFALQEAPALAKALLDFAKDEEDLLVKGGILGTEFLSAEEVEALAKLPSLDELRAQIIGLLSAPAQNLARTLSSGVGQLVNVLDAYARQESEAEATS